MKRLLYLSLITFHFSLITSPIVAQNPIIQTKYTADPAPYVHGDTLYLFTSHDNGVRDGYDMTDWQLYTSTDMVNWTDHGAVASLQDFGNWTGNLDNGAWAQQVIERNGYWYMYCPIQLHGIAVLRAESPYGPWTDPRKRQFINYDIRDIDPTVFIDDDGQAYIYWGNNGLWYAKLTEGMVNLVSSSRKEIALTTEAFGGYKEKYTKADGTEDTRIVGDDCFEEGPWVYKRNGKYYLVYAAGGIPEHLSYSMSDSPTGPWTYQGKIMGAPEGSFTIHPGVIDYKGHSYMFYHSGQLPGGNGFKRSVCVEEFQYNDDGTIPTIPFSKTGVEPVGTLNPYRRVEAETIAFSKGLETTKDATRGVYITSVDGGDYIKVRAVDFGTEGAKSVMVGVKGGTNAGRIEVCVDRSSDIVATINIPTSGDWTELSAQLSRVVTGVHDVYFYFRATDTSAKSDLLSFDYWQLSNGSETGIETVQSSKIKVQSYYDLSGRQIVNSKLSNSKLHRGIYIVNGKKYIKQ